VLSWYAYKKNSGKHYLIMCLVRYKRK